MKLKQILALAALAVGSSAWAQEVTWPLAYPSTSLTEIGIATNSDIETLDVNGGWYYLLNGNGTYASLDANNHSLISSTTDAEPIFINTATGWSPEVWLVTKEGYVYMPGSNAWTTNTNGADNADNRYWKYTLSNGKYKLNNQAKHKSDNKFLAPNGNGAKQTVFADKTNYTEWGLVPAYKAGLIGKMNQYYNSYINGSSDAKATALKASLEKVYNDIKDIQITAENYKTYFDKIQYAVAKVNANEVLVNPGFESCSIGGWTNGTDVKLGHLDTAPANNPKTGRWFAESYWGAGAFDFNQTTPALPAGLYKIGVTARNETGKAVYVYGNSSKSEIAQNNTNKYFTEVYLKNGGAIQLGVKCDDHPNATWFAIDDFTLEYLGNNVELASDELPTENVAANDWYKYAINVAGDYKITSTTGATIMYTQDGETDVDAETTSIELGAGESKVVEGLSVGTLYISANAETIITVAASVNSYEVGSATADIAYVQPGKVVTISYADATTNDANATLAFNGNPNITLNGETVEATATANGFTFTVPSVEAATTYTLSIPADAFGYAAGSAFNEAQEIEFKTPAIFDQIGYIYSPKFEKFVSRGNAYGTAATLDSYGLPVEIVTDANGNTSFKFIDNQLYLYGNDWAYTDGTKRDYKVEVANTANYSGFTFVSNNMPFYSNAEGNRAANNGIKGDNYNDDDVTIWQIKTKAERDDIKEAKVIADIVAVASTAGETVTSLSEFEGILATKVSSDQTSKVKSASLKSGIDGWTATNVRKSYSEYTTDQNVVEFYESAQKITQTVSNLEQGIYKVTLNGFFRAGTNANCVTYADYDLSNAYLKANDYQINLKAWASERTSDTEPNSKSTAATAFTDGSYLNTLYTYVGEDGKLQLTIDNPTWMGAGWVIFNNLTLTYYGGTAATAEDYSALATAIQDAELKTLGFDESEYAPYTNIDAIKALNAAKAIDKEKNNLQSDVQGATADLVNAAWTANTEEVNAVYDGTFTLTTKQEGGYLVPTGWTNLGYNTRVYNQTNKGSNAGIGDEAGCLFAKFTTTYGGVEGYEMPLKQGKYYLAFNYGGWNEVGEREIRVYNSENNAKVKPNTVKAKDNQAHVSTDAWSAYEGIIEIPEDGNYILEFYRQSTTQQNQIAISDIELKKAASANLLITSAKWGTFCAPFDVEKPADVTAYTVQIEGDKLVYTVAEQIKANTAYVVYSEDFVNETYNAKGNASESVETGCLVGTYETKSAERGTYLLQMNEGKVGFYKVNRDDLLVGANRCYLVNPSSSAAKQNAFYLTNPATAIEGLNAMLSGNVEGIYNAAGVKQNAMQKGLNIVKTADGKTVKVMVK